ncbi:hypothetical protein AVEN_104686-1 [Araneus ventricosus]|uniref:Uncharacterized protein n=1 Tax=Araneus ventricosus TaxID=182803 RepID=A0A4Y2BE01_ARAVE|nr:hypothetical protein AVEN_104686-1 [Araneus ventricosus]
MVHSHWRILCAVLYTHTPHSILRTCRQSVKLHLDFKGMASDTNTEREVLKCLRQQSKDFYAAGTGKLIERWDKCVNVNVDYVEKSAFFGSKHQGFPFFIFILQPTY